ANRPVAYPTTVLIAAAALSPAAQVAQARHSITGWLVAVIPALAFLALSKLVLSRTTAQPSNDEQPTHTGPAPHAEPSPDQPVPPKLLPGARMAPSTHRQATGHPITADTLATHLAISRDLAGQLLYVLDDTTITGDTPSSTVTHANGTSYPAASRP